MEPSVKHALVTGDSRGIGRGMRADDDRGPFPRRTPAWRAFIPAAALALFLPRVAFGQADLIFKDGFEAGFVVAARGTPREINIYRADQPNVPVDTIPGGEFQRAIGTVEQPTHGVVRRNDMGGLTDRAWSFSFGVTYDPVLLTTPTEGEALGPYYLDDGKILVSHTLTANRIVNSDFTPGLSVGPSDSAYRFEGTHGSYVLLHKQVAGQFIVPRRAGADRCSGDAPECPRIDARDLGRPSPRPRLHHLRPGSASQRQLRSPVAGPSQVGIRPNV